MERLAFDEMVNPSWSLPAVAARRSANVLLRGRMNPWAPIDVRGPLGRKLSRAIVAGAQAVPAVVEKRLRERMLQSLEGAARDRYEASNARTAALTGIDLAGFGYPVAPWAGNDRSLAAWSG